MANFDIFAVFKLFPFIKKLEFIMRIISDAVNLEMLR